jgi:FtsH-binding integral membrane protein
MKKRVLLIISILIILMGILALIPSINMGTEPAWHAAVKIVVGLVGLWVSLQKTGKTKTALLVIGILLVAMGLLDVLGLFATVTVPVWHSIVIIVVGAVAIYLGATNMKEE